MGTVVERTRGYVHRININAPLELVWRALIDPELLALWSGPGARVTARSGGSYYLRLNGDLEREALIDVFDPGRRLRLIYMPPRGLPESEAVMIDDFILDNGPVRVIGCSSNVLDAPEAGGDTIRRGCRIMGLESRLRDRMQ